MNFVLGTRGRLGRALIASLDTNNTIALNRETYAGWWADNGSEAAFQFFKRRTKACGTVYMAAGLINPSADCDEHLRVNYLLPKHIVEGATRAGLRVITFGTVMEQLVGNNGSNPYVSSKVGLGKYVAEQATEGSNVLHIRIHTLFGGGPPDKFMFLGQMLDALKKNTPFEMSSGTQLREYHHINDEVNAVLALASGDHRGVIDLNHGQPVSLRDIADHIFSAFDCHHLLKVGARPNPVKDNYGTVYHRTHALKDITFRDSLPALVAYLDSCLDLNGEKYEG